MRHDDRLATVLRIRSSSVAVSRIQFLQLIDLLGTSPAEARGDLIDQGYVRLRELAGTIPAADRAAALGAPGLRLRSPRLVAALVASEPQVATSAIRAADLTDEQWIDLIPALPPAARGLLRARADFGPAPRALLARLGIGDAALPAAETTELLLEPSPDPEPAFEPIRLVAAPPAPPRPSGIGAIVEKIEAFRRARDRDGAIDSDLPQLPLGDRAAPGQSPSAPAAIDFVTDAAGRVVWSQHPTGPMLHGRMLTGFETLQAGLRHRRPITGAIIALDGAPAIAGRWQVDAAPRFDAESGRFEGHAGRLRRLSPPTPTVAPAADTVTREADSLRQLLHELRTPVNAIQGYAEVIQHQLYGPTPHEYRALAAAIVADAARMLAGLEELDRLARLSVGALVPEAGACDLAAVVRAAAERAAPLATAQGFTLSFAITDDPLAVALAPGEVERLCWRIVTAMAGAVAPGETLHATASRADGRARVAFSLPASLADLDEAALFACDAAAAQGGLLGLGFALRLARAEARACAGSLVPAQRMLNLYLPLLTEELAGGDNPSSQQGANGAPAG